MRQGAVLPGDDLENSAHRGRLDSLCHESTRAMALDRSVLDAAPFRTSPCSRTVLPAGGRHGGGYEGPKSADGDFTRAALYEKARQQNLPGLSRMGKEEELQEALS